jgi:hypothetical protein
VLREEVTFKKRRERSRHFVDSAEVVILDEQLAY